MQTEGVWSAVPLVSVIIPAYNRAACIGRAIDSALRQSFGDFEIIVVDDGSSDGTGAAVARHADPRLRLLRHETNRGAAAARNTAIRAASGRLIAFLDSDDEWLPEKLERQVAAMRAAPADVLLTTTGYFMVRERSRERRERTPHSADWRRALLDGCVLSPGSTAMADRRAFEVHGLFDERLRRLEDWEWLLRYVSRHDLRVVPEPLARIHIAERMSAEPVLAAAGIIAETHGEAMRRAGHGTSARFRAGLLMEQAATCYYAGRPLRAFALLARSLALYPRRPPSFLAGVARRALRLLWHGRKAPPARPVEPSRGT